MLRAANLDAANGNFDVWYSDEHALALGVRQVNVTTATGTATTNYPLTAMTSNPGVATNPALGTTATTGDQAGTDLSGRPMSPSLYITDITNNPNNRSGDWQYGGTAIAPSTVFGSWKAFTRTVNNTTATQTVSVTADADPVRNTWNLGNGSDAPPAGVQNEGYGAELQWNLNALYSQGLLIPGHTYRFYVMVHDGDQNKVGGDAGQASFTYTYSGPSTPASLSGSVTGQGSVGLAGVVVTLTGTDDLGNAVTLNATTDAQGSYSFNTLQPGTYTVEEPAGYGLNQSNVGTVNGSSDGSISSTGDIFQIVLGPGAKGTNYNFRTFSG